MSQWNVEVTFAITAADEGEAEDKARGAATMVLKNSDFADHATVIRVVGKVQS